MDPLLDNILRAALIAVGGLVFWVAGLCLRLADTARARGATRGKVLPLRLLAAFWSVWAVAVVAPVLGHRTPPRPWPLMNVLPFVCGSVTSRYRDTLAREGFLPPKKQGEAA
jgi:hypothetical protein